MCKEAAKEHELSGGIRDFVINSTELSQSKGQSKAELKGKPRSNSKKEGGEPANV